MQWKLCWQSNTLELFFAVFFTCSPFLFLQEDDRSPGEGERKRKKKKGKRKEKKKKKKSFIPSAVFPTKLVPKDNELLVTFFVCI